MQPYLVLLTHPQTQTVTALHVRAATPQDAVTIAQAVEARIRAHERN